MNRSPYDEIVSIGALEITRSSADSLYVPLASLEEGAFDGVQLYEGGVLWEDEPATISFTLETTAKVRRAALSVNDHNELWLKCDWMSPLSYGGERTYRYAFQVEPNNTSAAYHLPFAFTCGFARVQVRIIFSDGRVALYESQDVVCLDEPRPGGGGQSGERAEESNVRDMYQTLVQAHNNQATEWMFSPQVRTIEGEALSADDDTDWAHEALSRTLRAASEALDLVYDGLEDEDDDFPNTSAEPDAGLFDTPENRAVRALLASLARRTEELRSELLNAIAEQDGLLSGLTALLGVEAGTRGHKQSLPALTLIEVERRQDADWLIEVTDLAERAELALEDFDAFMGTVGKIAFEVPPLEGLYAASDRYGQLREAMLAWGEVYRVHTAAKRLALHALKPDRLFEYYALHRMLNWLYEQGFRENEGTATPIVRYRYSLEDTYDKYDNEMRCANTYHLRREADGSTVDLYYQPVIYGDAREENGIDLHRTDALKSGFKSVWTPDYLLFVQDAQGVRRFAIDAKYCAWDALIGRSGKLADCVSKYLTRTSVGSQDKAGLAIDGVWLLCGKIDAPKLVTFDPVAESLIDRNALPEGRRATCGIAPLNRNAGPRKMGKLFAQFGLRPLLE